MSIRSLEEVCRSFNSVLISPIPALIACGTKGRMAGSFMRVYCDKTVDSMARSSSLSLKKLSTFTPATALLRELISE